MKMHNSQQDATYTGIS